MTEKNVNPFEIDKSDVVVAAPEFLTVFLDHDEDEDIDIMELTIVEVICLILLIS